MAWLRARSLPLSLWLGLRLWTLVWAAVAGAILPVAPVSRAQFFGARPLVGGLDGLLWGPWQRADTVWYLRIAAQGYSPTDLTTAFFPLYSVLIRVGSLLPLPEVAAAVLVSSATSLAAFLLLYEWALRRGGERIARRSILMLALFPTAFFLFAGYTEALFLALALIAFLSAEEGQWGWAGLAGGLAALTRAQGALIVIPLSILWLQQCKEKPRRRSDLLWLLPAPLAGSLFFYYLLQVTGSPAAWFAVEGKWRTAALPWEPILAAAKVAVSGDAALLILNGMELVVVFLMIGLTVMLLKRGRWAEAAYLATIVAPPLFTVARFTPFLPLASISRFALMGFPAFVCLMQIRPFSRTPAILLACCLLFQTFLLVLFTQWFFVG